MLKRGLAFCLVLSVASVARAGATIDMKPATGGGALTGVHSDAANTVCYQLGTPDAFALIDVFIQQTPAGTARELRHMQLDFSASELCPSTSACSNALFLVPQPTHGTDRFWYFGGGAGSTAEPTCANDADATCGDGHFFDTSFTQPIGREKVVSATWYFVTPTDLNGDPAYQRTLPASAAQKIGQLRVELPTEAGAYTLDAINAAQANPDLGGADFRFGFGVDVTGGDGVALTTWRANPGNNITGSPLTITMAANCGPVTGACCVGGNTCNQNVLEANCAGVWQGAGTTTCNNCGGPCTITLQSSSPADQGSLWRSERNIFYLTFNSAVTLPPAGSFKIEKITGGATPNCTYQDITSGFTLTLTNAVPPAAPGAANTVLQVRETPATGGLTEHRAWYRITSTAAWTNVCPFGREFVVQVGDADANRFVTAADVGAVNGSAPGAAAINSRFDIDGNGFRTAADVGIANGSQGPLPAKLCDPAPIP
jgi:hypothetical protein